MSKYGSIRSGKYASKREERRAQELTLLQRCGEISNLEEQVRYELVPRQGTERAVTYTADFRYTNRNGETVVEDSKGARTQQYVIRRKLMLWIHKIRVVEV